MSFSKRQSKWANSALVVNIHVADMIKEMDSSHPLVGVDWQRKMEQRAAVFGGGKLVVPVQRATDFMTGALSKSETPITSSYRLGVKETNCHEIYPPFITEAIRNALLDFDKRMPGFLCEGNELYIYVYIFREMLIMIAYFYNYRCYSTWC